MDKQQYDELVKEVGKQAADAMRKETEALEIKLKDQFQSVKNETISKEAFENFKKEELEQLNKKLADIQEIAKAQGNKINELTTNKGSNSKKTLEEVLHENAPKLKELYKAGHGNIEVPLSEIAFTGKAVTSIGVSTSIQAMDSAPSSPYAPGIGGSLSVFDIRYNPNFIMNYVDMGRTNQYRLAWINEKAGEGAVAEVAEGAAKPQLDIDFKVEISEAKKIAGMIKITEEFEADLPQLETQVRRLLMEKTVRGFDDAIYTAVIAAATGYTITSLDDLIDGANLWDSVGAELAQVASNNYMPNLIALNPVTHWRMLMSKDSEGRYLTPPFLDTINADMVESNKVAVNNALVGDISQYKVDIYKDFVLKLGWNNDDFQRNQFSVVCEVRYHRYISDNRKAALVYASLPTIQAQIDKPAA